MEVTLWDISSVRRRRTLVKIFCRNKRRMREARAQGDSNKAWDIARAGQRHVEAYSD
jgi:hypothetical protein